MQEAFFSTFFRGYLWELIASLAGVYYLIKVKQVRLINRLFVLFLWMTLIVDLTGFYALIAYYSDYRIIGFVEGTPFAQNYWLYNILKIFAFVFYFYYFINQLQSARTRAVLIWITWFFFITSWLNLIIFDGLFKGYAPFTVIGGTIILLICIALYFYQILRSDQILNFYRELPFYVAVGALLWHLSITPLFIYNKYGIMTQSADFVNLYLRILAIMNFTMYGLYAAGFIFTARSQKKKRIISIF